MKFNKNILKITKNLIFFAATLTASCAFADQSQLTLSGSSTIAPVALEVAKLFESENPNVRVDVQAGGSSRGVADARAGLSDIGMVSRALSQEESDLVATTIALDGIAIIIHKANPVANLSDQQIKDIYTGKIQNWKEVGGADKPITVINKAEGRSTLELFLHHYSLKADQIKASVIIGDNEQGIKTVAGNKNAIGYVSIGTAEYDAKNGVAIKLLPMNGVQATVANVQAGTFPLARPLNLVTKKEPGEMATRFINFVNKSSAAQKVIVDEFFVPIVKR